MVIWKDVNKEEAIVFYDDHRKVSTVDGKTAQLAIDTWDRIKNDNVLTIVIHNPILWGPWPNSELGVEKENTSTLITHQFLMFDASN